jgi:hypothetical protein
MIFQEFTISMKMNKSIIIYFNNIISFNRIKLIFNCIDKNILKLEV